MLVSKAQKHIQGSKGQMGYLLEIPQTKTQLSHEETNLN